MTCYQSLEICKKKFPSEFSNGLLPRPPELDFPVVLATGCHVSAGRLLYPCSCTVTVSKWKQCLKGLQALFPLTDRSAVVHAQQHYVSLEALIVHAMLCYVLC